MSKRLLLLSACALLCFFSFSCGGSPKSTSSTGGNGNGGGGSNDPVQFTTPTSSPTIELGQTVNLTVTAPAGDTVTWTLQNGNGTGSPAGKLTPNGTSATYAAPAVISPAPACGSEELPDIQMNVTASDGNGDSAELTVVVLQTTPCVSAPPKIQTCTSTSSATTCSAYPPANASTISCPPNGTLVLSSAVNSNSQAFTVGGFSSVTVSDGISPISSTPWGQPPFSWALAPGSAALPSGISLVTDPTTTSHIFINGTPTSAGCFPFTLQITDALGGVGTQQFFVVAVPPPLKIQEPNITFAYGGNSYLTNLVAIGGQAPYSWIPAPNANTTNNPNSPEDIPQGLSLTFPQNSTAVIAGTVDPQDVAIATTNGPYGIYLQATDSQSPYPALGTPALSSISVLSPPSLCQSGNPLTGTSGFGGTATGGSVALNSFLKGSYAFLLHGFDAHGPVAIAGSIQVDGSGNVSGGEEDVTRSGGSQTVTIVPAGSSYVVGPETNRGCLTLQDSSGTTSQLAFTAGSCTNDYKLPSTGTIGPSKSACGLTTTGGVNVPAGVYTSGRMVEMDSTGTRVSGMVRMQDTTSFSGGLSGQYAFGLSGWDTGGKHYAAAGSAQASSGSFSSAAADINDGGTVASALTGGTGAIGAVDSNGRSAGTLTVGSSSFDLAMYVVGKNEVMLATTDLLSASHPIASGEAISTQGPFNTASLANSHMFHLGGLNGTSPDASIGTVAFDGQGSFTGNLYEDQAGTLGTSSATGVYAIEANSGRMTFSSVSNQNFAHPFVAYVIPPASTLALTNCINPAACVTGFLVGTDPLAQDGVMDFQTPTVAPPPPFNNLNVLGDFFFGVNETLDSLSASTEGYVTTQPTSGSLTTGILSAGHQDHNYGDPNYCLSSNCTMQVPQEQINGGTYTVNSDGSGAFGGFNGETVSVTNGRIIFYLDESPANLHPSVMVGEQ